MVFVRLSALNGCGAAGLVAGDTQPGAYDIPATATFSKSGQTVIRSSVVKLTVKTPYKIGSGSYFAYAPGGGLDYRLTHRIVLRAEYEHQFWPSVPGIPGDPSHGLQPSGFNFGFRVSDSLLALQLKYHLTQLCAASSPFRLSYFLAGRSPRRSLHSTVSQICPPAAAEMAVTIACCMSPPQTGLSLP